MSHETEIKWEVIHTYSRAEAIKDGVLVDVSLTASEAGFKYPVALTSAVWHDCVSASEYREERQRLWHLLMTLRRAILAADPVKLVALRFYVRLRKDSKDERVSLKAVCGPGDDGAPVLTVMNTDED